MKFILLLLASAAFAQDLPPVSATSDYARLHTGVSTPKLLHSSDPEYTPQALQAGIEGSVVLEAVVNRDGRVAYASVLSPLPAGLDRQALASVKHWRYSPAIMDAEQVPVLMTIDVLFRLPYRPGAEAAAAQQKAVQSLVQRISTLSQPPSAADIAELKSFAGQGSAAAIGLLGQLKVRGAGIPQDRAAGLADLGRAADSLDAPSLLFLGRAALEGSFLPRNEAQAWLLIRRAAFMGSSAAQQLLAARCEREHNFNEARWYYRLCAARAEPVCENQLGKLLVSSPGSPNDFAQGVAWLELASQHQFPGADALWRESSAKLSSIQFDWVSALKPHLELRGYKGF